MTTSLLLLICELKHKDSEYPKFTAISYSQFTWESIEFKTHMVDSALVILLIVYP